MLMLLDPSTDRHYIGDDRVSLMHNTGRVVFDMVGRCVVIDGKPDTVTYSTDFTDDEMIREMAARAMVLLGRRGWLLFTEA